MKFLKVLAATAATLAMTSAAQAQDSNVYGGLGLSATDLEGLTLYSGKVLLGADFSENFAAEAEGQLGLSSKNGVKLDNSFAGFLVGKVPAGDNFDLFGRVGYHTSKVGIDAFGESDSASFDGIAFGGGIKVGLNEVSGIRLEYTNYDGDGGSADSFSASYVRKF